MCIRTLRATNLQYMQPRQVYGYPSTVNTTLIFLFIFILCFFPGVFFSILRLPLHQLKLGSPPSKDCSPNNPATATPSPTMSWFQKSFTLPSKSRGSYLITDIVVKELPEIKNYKVGILHLFVQHTSCALSMNENWDSEVREDMTDALERIVPYDKKGNLYRHSAEGEDDMPAHIKSALIGSSVTIPITNGRLNTGTWQGIWYLEFRASKHSRTLVATIQGEKA
ncbi:secondary thiamine-phosphate synthase enzyme [Verruconis gallopava]|uniref:Secondary thiamine-phosphate synthase enzyme n=1 Tax=Verruconis gallopava TaxID=253628 RepID=A0A0D2A443_9PEZI|nr:secondary thiamine-phosphate synthase enzyme [Verruconis gallopava]KIW01563.1 secondary thiamine-phosphate synthase enzyme [Verruconis gallopava]